MTFPKLTPWQISLLAGGLFFAVLIQVPQVIHSLDARSQGILVDLNSDEDVYLARVEESLQGRPSQSDEAFIGDPALTGSQPALSEVIFGTMFRPFGLRAATVLQILDSLTCFVFFIALCVLFVQCGFKRRDSFIAAFLFCLLQLNNLNRPIHPALGVLLVLLSFNGLLAGMNGRKIAGILGGALLGALVGIHFWNWTFAWLAAALLLAWEIAELYHPEHRGKRGNAARLKSLLLFLGVGVLAALPFVIDTVLLSHNPLFEVAKFRSGMFPSHVPESTPYSVIFAVMVGMLAFAKCRHLAALRPHFFVVILVITSFIVINQQIVHGITFNFVSHYLMQLVIAAFAMVLLALSTRVLWLRIGAAFAIVYIAAVAWDGRWVLTQFTPRESDFAEQHFSTLLPSLDQLPRQTILSDPESSAFIAGATKHDIVYSVYLKNVLMTHEEIAERFCLTQLALAPADRHIADREWLIYPDAVSAFRSDPSVRQKEVQMVEEACARMDKDPIAYLQKYHVQLILWDDKRQPKWDYKRFGVPLQSVDMGNGWSLWSL